MGDRDQAGNGETLVVNAVSTVDEQALAGLQASLLPITVEYSERQTELPSHHRDPFDRLLISQALVEEVPVISADTTFEQYGVTRIW
jgi:PIN domain nuclease of toxin-antitoxin system